jgi:hypothetical protein
VFAMNLEVDFREVTMCASLVEFWNARCSVGAAAHRARLQFPALPACLSLCSTDTLSSTRDNRTTKY